MVVQSRKNVNKTYTLIELNEPQNLRLDFKPRPERP